MFPILCDACAMTVVISWLLRITVSNILPKVFAFAYRWAILTGREQKINSWWGILLMACIQASVEETILTHFYRLSMSCQPQ